MKYFKYITTITCSSFTCIVLLFAVFSRFDLTPPLSNEACFVLFGMSLSISLLMFLFEKLQERFDFTPSAWLDILIRILICYAVVFFEGVFWGMVPFAWDSLLAISPVLIPTFLITYLVFYLSCVRYADDINREIKRKSNS